MNKLTKISFIQPKIINASNSNVIIDEIFYIYSDHLGTPRKITNQDNILQWSWNNIEPFGDNEPISASNIEFNLRFSGQYYDQETKTNYNLFRDYNSSLGRYLQSDPIGLSRGLNSYAYANQNPLSFSDPLGLFTTLIFVKDELVLNHVALMINNKIYDINPGNNKKQNVNYFVNYFYSFFYFNPDSKNSDNSNTGDFFSQYLTYEGYNSKSFDLYHLKLSLLEEENLIHTCNLMSGNYNLFLNNCASFINHILSKNKIKKSTDMNKLMTPYLFQILLENDYVFKSRLIKKETKTLITNYNQYINQYTNYVSLRGGK